MCTKESAECTSPAWPGALAAGAGVVSALTGPAGEGSALAPARAWQTPACSSLPQVLCSRHVTSC